MTRTTLKHQTKLITLLDRHIATCTAFRDTISEGNTDISAMTASMSQIRDHISHRQRPAAVEKLRAAQLIDWTAEAADWLRGQGIDPVVRKNQIVWRDDAGHLHTIVFDWYPDSPCVRMYYDHYTGYVFAAEARRLGLAEYNLRGYTSVAPHPPGIELTTLPAEMSKVIVWALSGRGGDAPCEWDKYGDRNIWSTAAVTAYRAGRRKMQPTIPSSNTSSPRQEPTS